MTEYFKTTFWERFFVGFITFIPITGLTSCFVAFVLDDHIGQGFAVWGGECCLLALGMACCPTAEMFRKRFWHNY